MVIGGRDLVCQICGVSFYIGRIRTASEPDSHSWDVNGRQLSEEDASGTICSLFPEQSGCSNVRVPGMDVLQHVAGPGCVCDTGFSGCRIRVEEMKDMQRPWYLVRKPLGQAVDAAGGSTSQQGTGSHVDGSGDQDGSSLVFDIIEKYYLENRQYEEDSRWFLTASTVENIASDIKLSKHPRYAPEGHTFVVERKPSPLILEDRSQLNGLRLQIGIPVHLPCWKLWEKSSMKMTGAVDVEGFVALWSRHACTNCGSSKLRYDAVVSECRQYPRWVHKVGTEYLAANPVDIPGLELIMRTLYKDVIPEGDGAFMFEFLDAPKRKDFRTSGQGSLQNSTNEEPFQNLPSEIRNSVLNHLCTKDIASLRLASRQFRQIPKSRFRTLIKEELPWFWEVDALKALEEDRLSEAFHEHGIGIIEVFAGKRGLDENGIAWLEARMNRKHLETNWLQVYKRLKSMKMSVLGVRNRVRIWSIVEDILVRIAELRQRTMTCGSLEPFQRRTPVQKDEWVKSACVSCNNYY